MARTHFIIALEPQQPLTDPLIALCGTEVIHPESTGMTDVLRWGVPDFDSLRDCQGCIEAVEKAAENKDGKLYIYGIIAGQLTRTVEEVA